jgi:GTPase SAR1 family protein
MSESSKIIIKYFCDRFLELNYYPSDLKSILNLDISSLRHIEEKDFEKFKKINLCTLRDLTKVQYSDLERLTKKSKISKVNLKKALIASYLVANAWIKRSEYLKKTKMKVVVAGLDYAGKTSLINRLINDHNYNDIINLEPTKGANVEEYQSERLNLAIWDLGGQKDNINEYFESPERFFVNIDVLIFVFDSQDDIRYIESIAYLKEILNILEFMDENPYILALLNKADFDLLNDPDFQIKIEYLTEKITEILKQRNKPLNCEIIPTSIYNYYSSEPEIAKSIKNIFSKKPSEGNFELESIEEKLQKILDINLKLMDKVLSEISEVKRVLVRLSPSDITQSLFSVPFEKVPIDYVAKSEKLKEDDKKKKSKKRIQRKKRKKRKKGQGPPKPLKVMPVPKSIIENTDVVKKFSPEELNKVKGKLTNITDDSNKDVEPPMVPIKNSKTKNIDVKKLKPPPSPIKVLKEEEFNPGSARTQILNELKEIFKKRGLVSRYSVQS